MKKKILMAMMLCICVLGLTGCNKQEENSRTLEVAFKKEQKEGFEGFKMGVLKGAGGIITDVDIVENEIFLIAENEMFQSMVGDEETQKFFDEIMDEMMNEIGDDINMKPIIESIDEMVEDYNGKTIISYVFRTPSGDDLYSISFDKLGLIK